VVRLTEIFRQAGESGIVRAAAPVNQGRCPSRAAGRRRRLLRRRGGDAGAIWQKIVTMVRERIPARFGLDPLRDVQVLTR